MLSHEERVRRLKSMLTQVAGTHELESLTPPPQFNTLESMGGEEAASDAMKTALQKLERNQALSPQEAFQLEAIVLPGKRPVVFVNGDQYDDFLMPEWTFLNEPAIRSRFKPLFSSIGRVEVPLLSSVPYGGTAFVVGSKLMMTNRHVAKLFTEGRGLTLIYQPGSAEIDFRQERNTPRNEPPVRLKVTGVKMIHPYWDMALLQVDGLPAAVRPLSLSIRAPEELLDENVAVVGYPARDHRNDFRVQDEIFENQYGIKRMQPGKLRNRLRVLSFENQVEAVTHDSSTLGGNSGSAVINIADGTVVALHFAGVYLEANYAVPTFELARDPRVVDAGVNFNGSVAPTTALDQAWRDTGLEKTPTQSGGAIQATAPSIVVPTAGTTATFTVPLQVTVSFGAPVLAAPATIPGAPAQAGMPTQTGAAAPSGASAATDVVEKVPVIYPKLGMRSGYREGFLSFEVPMPTLTSLGKSAAAKLENGTRLLKYHRFSLVMHSQRRLAIFTAANVDWRRERREIDGDKPTRKKLNGFTGNEKEDWITDSRISLDHQLPDYFYVNDNQAFDRGHLVRRDDVAWGKTFEEMQKGNGDTFHMTNCSPQVAEYNQSKYGDFNWGQLENMVERETKTEKVSVFAGPMLDSEDRFFHGKLKSGSPISIQIPRRFWKVIVADIDGEPAVFGFILDQDLANVDLHTELAVPDAWKDYLRPISEIEEGLFGLAKLTWFKEWDQYEV